MHTYTHHIRNRLIIRNALNSCISIYKTRTQARTHWLCFVFGSRNPTKETKKKLHSKIMLSPATHAHHAITKKKLTKNKKIVPNFCFSFKLCSRAFGLSFYLPCDATKSHENTYTHTHIVHNSNLSAENCANFS